MICDVQSFILSTCNKFPMIPQIQRARDYYQKAKEGIPMLAPDARFAVQVCTVPVRVQT